MYTYSTWYGVRGRHNFWGAPVAQPATTVPHLVLKLLLQLTNVHTVRTACTTCITVQAVNMACTVIQVVQAVLTVWTLVSCSNNFSTKCGITVQAVNMACTVIQAVV